MTRGRYAWDYEHNPQINKPLDEIFDDLGEYTMEIYPENENSFKWVSFYTICPPLYYQGQFLKGIYISQGVDLLHQHCPQIKDLFISAAAAMSHGYPCSEQAEVYCAVYDNPLREAWFRKRFPEKAHIELIPRLDTDFNTNEYSMIPVYPQHVSKDIDLLCVANLNPCKNVPLLARGLKVYREKYPEQPIKLTWITAKDLNLNLEGFSELERKIMRELEEILIHPSDYINFVGRVNYGEMREYYSRAKFTILGSLNEGKNRSLHESQSCNTPILCCRYYNQYIRGEQPIMGPNAGLLFDYDPEDIADTIHQGLQSYGDFQPRRDFLRTEGRKNMLNETLTLVSYYRDHLPEYQPYQHYENVWLDEAISDNYRMSLHNYLYGINNSLCYVMGLDNVKQRIEYFEQMMRYRGAPLGADRQKSSASKQEVMV